MNFTNTNVFVWFMNGCGIPPSSNTGLVNAINTCTYIMSDTDLVNGAFLPHAGHCCEGVLAFLAEGAAQHLIPTQVRYQPQLHLHQGDNKDASDAGSYTLVGAV